ncbi:MAG TPA: hypothetical protein VFS20_19380, partial [Longimicrobium sp.]|nr:hypothetical protein [Longimicrobium sp.]
MSEVLLAAAARTDEPLARVLSFSRRFGRDTTALAMHAALPLGLSPELVHLLRANFVPRAPFIAEADLLLSPLCAEVGGGMYEMDADVRELLLAEMARTPGYGRARLRSVARFLGVWAARALDDTADPDVQGHLRVQQWVALAYADPARAAEELAAALRGGVERADRGEVARVARLTTVLSAPLAAQLELRRYAGTVERIAASGGMASGSGEVAVGRERLPGIERVARLWRPGAGHATGEEMEAAEQAQRRAGGEGAGAAPVEGGYRVARVLVTGQAGVGKTALIASLLEQPFQPAPATHGVVLSRGEVAPGDGFGGARDVVFHEARMMDGPLPLVAPDPAAVLVVVPQTAPAPYDEGWVRGFRGNNPDTPVFVVATGA